MLILAVLFAIAHSMINGKNVFSWATAGMTLLFLILFNIFKHILLLIVIGMAVYYGIQWHKVGKRINP